MLTLRPYQEVGRDFLAARRHALLADEMRVGKTPQAILAAEKVGAQRTLVVCPAIAVPQWHAEWWRWWPQSNVAPTVVSYDRLRLNAAGLLDQEYDLAIMDECHFAKNPAAQRTKLVYGRGGVGWCAKRLWVLSGTPATKHAAELWPMLRAFGATGMTYDDFIRYFCMVEPFTQRVVGTQPKKIPEVRALLAKIMLRRTRKEVAPDMPAIGFSYLRAEIDADVQYPEGLADDALLAWLESHPTTDREDRIAVAHAKAKVLEDEIVEVIQSGQIKQTVVFGWHVEPLRELAMRLSARGIPAATLQGDTPTGQRQRVQADFREGRLGVVCANILAAGTAIDLSAASHGYFLELDWLPGQNMQAANRLVSMDKAEPVTFDVVTWPGSADDRVQRVLLRRAQELGKMY